MADSPSDSIAAGDGVRNTYHCGTLTYTKVGLVALFASLLWGNFCFTIMQSIVPGILPLRLKGLGASNGLMGLVLVTAPGIMGMGLGPWISVASDRHRGRWGRRIPFIAWTLPFLSASLALLGFSDSLGGWLTRHMAWLADVAPATTTIAVIAVLFMLFQFFGAFVGSVFFYLFNDVIPPQFMGRFFGWYRITCTGASLLYNLFVFRYAETHMREIFLASAALYFVAFAVLCVVVREGEYPAVEREDERDARPGAVREIVTFLRESFTDKFYWAIFASIAFGTLDCANNMFGVFFNRDMGLSLAQIGRMIVPGQIAAILCIALLSKFIDRWHPMRIAAYYGVYSVLHSFMAWVWSATAVPPMVFMWTVVVWAAVAQIPAAIGAAASLPLFMKVFPPSRYGQFCSAQALVGRVTAIAAAVPAGLFLDWMRRWVPREGFEYRLGWIWDTVFSAAGAISILIAYRMWYRRGGDAGFHPPAPWAKAGVEPIPIVTIVGPQTRWLKVAFRLHDAIMILTVAAMPCLMGWMYLNGMAVALRWHAFLLWPAALLVCLAWMRVRRGIERDMERARRGEPPRNGIPHHGMLIACGVKFLCAVMIWGGQVVACINRRQDQNAIVFTAANLLMDAALVGVLVLMCRMERHFSTKIDVNLATAG